MTVSGNIIGNNGGEMGVDAGGAGGKTPPCTSSEVHPAIEVLRNEVARLDSRLAEIDAIHNSNPVGEIIGIREDAQKILDEHRGDHAKIAELIRPLAKREKKAQSMLKKQTDSKLWDERFQIESRRHKVASELGTLEFKMELRAR